MKTLLQLAVVGIIIYFGVTQLIPWLEGQGEGLGRSGSATELSDSDCVDQARRAADTFTSEIRGYRPPVDESRWNSSQSKIEDRLYGAESSCSCARKSCQTASLALGALRGLLSEYDSAFRGDGMPPMNAAREIDEIFNRLNEAAGQARSGD